MKIGDVVMFSRKHLQSSGQILGPVPFAVGTVKAIDGHLSMPVLTVDFDRYLVHDPDMFGDPLGILKVIEPNLILKSERHLEHA